MDHNVNTTMATLQSIASPTSTKSDDLGLTMSDSLSMSTLGTPFGLSMPKFGDVKPKHNRWTSNIGLFYRPKVGDYQHHAHTPSTVTSMAETTMVMTGTQTD